MSFLTVEDVNGILFSNQYFWWYELDTACIDPNGTAEFENVKVDFLSITKTLDDNMGAYVYEVKVDNSLWTTGNYALDTNGTKLSTGVSNTTLDTAVDKRYAPIKIYLYMGSIKITKNQQMLGYLLEDTLLLTLKDINHSYNVKYFYLRDSSIRTVTMDLKKGFNEVIDGNVTYGYLLVKLLKTDFQFTCNQSLSLGKVNKVYLGTNTDYKPNGDMVGDNEVSISVKYKNSVLPVNFDGSDYFFNLDLSDKTEAGTVRFKVIVESNEVINSTETNVVLNSQYQTVNTFSALQSACNTGGSDIIQVGGNITFTSSISIAHNIKIIGNAKTFNLNEHNFTVQEGVTFNAENVRFNNGDTAIIQKENSIVELTDCSFTNCESSNYNGLGSCIFCDVDLDNLEVTNDFETTLNNCLFTDNQSCILHGGQLTVDKCKLHNTDDDYVNVNNVAFLYQTDGNATITNSIFDIDYDTTDFCTNQINIGFAQAVLMCGETAMINGASHTDLQSDNSLPFFNNPINNQSHLFVKYYYPQISTCVYSSPISSRESQAICHAVSGVDWIYKNNVQVTRSDWNSQNENNRISW